MKRIIHDSNKYGKLTERRLAKLEKQLGVRLPDDYRAFMLEHNGGRPEPQGFAFRRDGATEESLLECLFPIHDRSYRDSAKPGGASRSTAGQRAQRLCRRDAGP